MSSTKALCTALLLGLCSLALAGCAKQGEPRPGMYRAGIDLPAGELVLQLELGTEQDRPALWVIDSMGRHAATEVALQQNHLSALLPNDMGRLAASTSRERLDGELQLSPAGAAPRKFVFHGAYGWSYRFFQEASTDNADVSGHWRLQCEPANGELVEFELMQTHDQVDGAAQLSAQASLALIGQMHEDDLRLSGLGAHTALLYAAQIDKHGDLDGELSFGSERRHCAARRVLEEPAAEL